MAMKGGKMPRENHEVDYTEAVLAMRTLLSLKEVSDHEEISDNVSFEIAVQDSKEGEPKKALTKQ